jgi:hypothetical protein
MTNFHLHITNFEYTDVVYNRPNRKDVCILFVGKLNWFGNKYWEQQCLPYYRNIRKRFKGNIVIKFLLYKSDSFSSGGFSNWLSGYGDMYEKLFSNSKSWLDIYNHNNNHSDVLKSKIIKKWLLQQENKTQLRLNKFKEYTAKVFDFADTLQYYTIDPNTIHQRIIKRLENINSDIGYTWQHLQVHQALLDYPDMWEDTPDIVLKTRYDVKMHDHPWNTFENLTKLFWYLDDVNLQQDYSSRIHKHNLYDKSTVMFTNMVETHRGGNNNNIIRKCFMPDDVVLYFNLSGIKRYAFHIEDWIIEQLYSHHQIDKSHRNPMNTIDLPIHSSLGQFFLDKKYNTIDICPTTHQDPHDGIFGLPLRYTVEDKFDDYKIRWYNNNQLTNMLEKFSVNT